MGHVTHELIPQDVLTVDTCEIKKATPTDSLTDQFLISLSFLSHFY